MAEKIVIIEAFNNEARNIRRNCLIDIDGMLCMAESDNVSLKIEKNKNGSFRVEIPYQDFLDAIKQENIMPALVTAFQKADNLYQSDPARAALPQKLEKNPDIQISISQPK